MSVNIHTHACTQGEFMSAEHSQEVPISPASLPAASSVDPTSKMVFIWLTSYTFDTAAYIYKGAAYMDYSIKNEEVASISLSIYFSDGNCFRYQMFYLKPLQTISQSFQR